MGCPDQTPDPTAPHTHYLQTTAAASEVCQAETSPLVTVRQAWPYQHLVAHLASHRTVTSAFQRPSSSQWSSIKRYTLTTEAQGLEVSNWKVRFFTINASSHGGDGPEALKFKLFLSTSCYLNREQ